MDVEDRLRERRLTHRRRSRRPPPRTIGIAADPQGADGVGNGSAVTEASALLRGHGASPGQCEGRARVVLDASLDAELRPGEILVAPFTDPAWTPLFLTAGAAVVEVGSFLSHAGTVAREYGLPCVVDVAGCTRRIRTGARVRVDGDRGLVQILEEAPA
jgi:pyruvate,water dikinase